mmetsp:Transcript_15490/g.33514  ORF Transcript_15490/g.33514 Transcript_15490/m.33514 type:complete len:223 (-) Transcript_15490:487-1155(-)
MDAASPALPAEGVRGSCEAKRTQMPPPHTLLLQACPNSPHARLVRPSTHVPARQSRSLPVARNASPRHRVDSEVVVRWTCLLRVTESCHVLDHDVEVDGSHARGPNARHLAPVPHRGELGVGELGGVPGDPGGELLQEGGGERPVELHLAHVAPGGDGEVHAAVALDDVAPEAVHLEDAEHQLRPPEGVGALEGHVQREVPHQVPVRPSFSCDLCDAVLYTI